jgi:hypothetical protein
VASITSAFISLSLQAGSLNMTTRTRRPYRRILAATLLLGGALAAPAFADGTSAGTSISNTAVSTYEDVNAPGTTINSSSNTVVVQVAEVAGITVTASGTALKTDVNTDGKVNSGDTVNYTYTVTNVGNDPTQFRIPNLATVTGPGVAGALEISYDGGTTWTPPLTGSEVITTSIPVGGSVMVRVPVTVQSGAQTNDIINVTLGNTPGDAQNQLRSPDGGDVYTVDNLDTVPKPEVVGTPVNGVREASMTQKVTVDSSLKNYALATLLKTRAAYDDKGTVAITGDTLDYGLSLRVESSPPAGSTLTPVPLVGANISLNGATAARILVSDAIPAGTELAAAPTPPPGWQAVYTTEAIASKTANAAAWKTFPLQSGDTLAGVTRVGFVNNPATITSVAPGTTVNGFTVQVKVTSTATSLTVANMAQLFGQTSGTNTPVYDDSGDNMPSNFNDDGTPLASMDTNADGIPDILPPVASIDDGYVNTPTNPEMGSDTANNNSGTGPGGEANPFTIAAPVAGAVLNGPQNAADAIGPTNNNDDFTNKSSLVPAGTLPGALIDPASVAFTNTVKNGGTAANPISLVPVPPADPLDLPINTVVTITYGAQSRSYVWDGAKFEFDSDGSLTTTGDRSLIDATAEYITIPSLAPGATANYGVEVNLPANTPLSTDVGYGFPVPVVAFIDDATPGYSNLATEPSNTTIDRVYTGFVKMVKESRVLAGTGPAVQGTDGTFSATLKKPAPGNILEYRITYANISDAQSGTGNVILTATKLAVTEDGTLADDAGAPLGSNNWALDNDNNGQIDTSNIVGSAVDSGASTIIFMSGNPATTTAIDQTGTTVNTDVTKYVDNITGSVAPGVSRTFGFQRKVN